MCVCICVCDDIFLIALSYCVRCSVLCQLASFKTAVLCLLKRRWAWHGWAGGGGGGQMGASYGGGGGMMGASYGGGEGHDGG